MGSIFARSMMAKKRTDVQYATGVNLSQVLSISFSVISDSIIHALISSEVYLD